MYQQWTTDDKNVTQEESVPYLHIHILNPSTSSNCRTSRSMLWGSHQWGSWHKWSGHQKQLDAQIPGRIQSLLVHTLLSSDYLNIGIKIVVFLLLAGKLQLMIKEWKEDISSNWKITFSNCYAQTVSILESLYWHLLLTGKHYDTKV